MHDATTDGVEGRFLVQRGGRGYAAKVTIVLDRTPAQPSIELACTGRGWSSQGTPEEVGAHGYATWKAGACAGVAFALRCAGLHTYGVRITRIVGMTTDTNPTIVAAAAARAVWRATDFTPPPALLARFDAQVLASWDSDADALPVFAP